jgi:hypothetical protein
LALCTAARYKPITATNTNATTSQFAPNSHASTATAIGATTAADNKESSVIRNPKFNGQLSIKNYFSLAHDDAGEVWCHRKPLSRRFPAKCKASQRSTNKGGRNGGAIVSYY